MSVGFPPPIVPGAASPLTPVAPDRQPAGAQPHATGAAAAASDGRPLPQGGPPEHVLAEVDKAQKVLDRLAAQNIEMRFDVDHQTGEIKVELRDGDGHTIRTITLTAALDVAAGHVAPLDAEEAAEPGDFGAGTYDSGGRR